MQQQQSKKTKRFRRHARVRAKVWGTKSRPRLSVFRSSKHVFVQLIDDAAAKTLIGISDKSVAKKKITKSDRAHELGKLIAQKAAEHKIEKAVFDRGGYQYRGRIQKVAEGARAGGLVF